LRTSEQPARNDQYGDPLPEHALARMGTLRFRHSGPVGCVAYAPDGRLLASAAGMHDGTLRLWDVATGKERCRFPGPPHTAGAYCILFSGGGQTLAFQTKDRAVVIWDVTPRKELRRLPAEGDMIAGTFSRDGKALTVALREPRRG
jgi:WD40 repeat protein